jgi:hypothetical protein
MIDEDALGNFQKGFDSSNNHFERKSTLYGSILMNRNSLDASLSVEFEEWSYSFYVCVLFYFYFAYDKSKVVPQLEI